MNLEKLEGLSKEMLIQLRETIEKVEIDRFYKWIKAIEENNKNEFNRLLSLGINFPLLNTTINNTNIFSSIGKRNYTNKKDFFDIENIQNLDLLNEVINLDYDKICNNKDYEHWTKNFSYIDALKKMLKETINSQLFSKKVKSDDIYIDLCKIGKGTNHIDKSLVLFMVEYYDKHNDIKKSDKILNLIEKYDLQMIYLKKINHFEDFMFLLEEKNYKKYLTNLNEEAINNLMDDFLKVADVKIYKYLHEDLNFPLPTKNPGYSSLFSKSTDSVASIENGNKIFDFQVYIIGKMEDITRNKHMVLRTILHDEFSGYKESKLNLLKLILNRYSEEELKEIPLILKDRKENISTKYLKEYYESFTSFKELKDDLMKNEQNNEKTHNVIKRNKI